MGMSKSYKKSMKSRKPHRDHRGSSVLWRRILQHPVAKWLLCGILRVIVEKVMEWMIQ